MLSGLFIFRDGFEPGWKFLARSKLVGGLTQQNPAHLVVLVISQLMPITLHAI